MSSMHAPIRRASPGKGASGIDAEGRSAVVIRISPAIARMASGVQNRKPCSVSAMTWSACGECQYILRITSGDGRGRPLSAW